MVRSLLTVVAFILASPMAMASAAADGMMYNYTSVYDDWSLSAEETQFGLINYVDGRERLLLAVRINEIELADVDQAVWLVAIPGAPEEIDIDLMPGATELEGESMADLAAREFCSNLLMGYGTQLYPMLVLPFLAVSDSEDLGRSDDSDGVDVSSHLESRGLTMEVLSTQYTAALAGYLEDRNLELDDDSYQVIGEYIGEDYAFVASWVSNVTQFLSETDMLYDPSSESHYYEFGFFVEFPTERMYYPLRLTSVYGDTVVPMLLQVIGHVEPDGSEFEYGQIDMSVQHMRDSTYYVGDDLTPFFTNDGTPAEFGFYLTDVEYTQIVITAPSSDLAADLWMVPASSTKLAAQEWVIDNGFLAALWTIAAMSAVTGLVAGALVFAPYKPILWKFAALGLANVMTIVGLWLAYRKLDVELTMTRSAAPVPSVARREFLFVYSFIFAVSVSIVLFAFWV